MPYWSFICVVRAPNAAPPALLKVRLTCQNVLDVMGLALAAWTWLPSTLAWSRTNLYGTPLVPLDSPQATIWAFGSSQTAGL